MPRIYYTKKEFLRNKKEVLTESEYLFLRDNYNRFTQREKEINKNELKELLKRDYSFRGLIKFFLAWCVGLLILSLIDSFFILPRGITEFYLAGIFIAIVWLFARIGGRLFTSDSYHSYYRDFIKFYYKHRLIIEETNNYLEYKEKAIAKSKSFFS